MPSIRVGFSSDLNIRGGKVGFGTTNLTADLEVAGQITAEDAAGSGGVSTFREYQGFSQSEARISNNVTIDNSDGGPYSSLTGEIKITGETTVSSGSTVEVGKTKTLTVTDRFAVPLGETNNRDNTPEAGTTRFNQDFGTLEFFDGVNWKTVNSYARYHGGAAGRGVIMGGRNTPGAEIANISYIQITTRGNAVAFGELNVGARETGGCLGSETRSIMGGGQNAEEQNEIEYVTTASQGNAIDFGDLTNRVRSMGAVSSSTRGLFASGCVHPNTDTAHIDMIEIATVGSTVDFGGDHVAARNVVAIGSPIKACFGNGNSSTTMRTVNFASHGNTVFFGDATQDTSGAGTIGNSTRGLFCGGYTVPGNQGCPAIGSITFASLGNTTDFGEMFTGVTANNGGMSTQTKGVIGPGQETCTGSNTHFPWLDEITISTYGSAVDFGDAGPHSNFNPKVSDSHGGLGGF